MTPEQKLKKLQRALKEYEREMNLVIARRDTLLTTLQEKFNCESLEKAKQLLAKSIKKHADLQHEFDDRYNSFKTEFGTILNSKGSEDDDD